MLGIVQCGRRTRRDGRRAEDDVDEQAGKLRIQRHIGLSLYRFARSFATDDGRRKSGCRSVGRSVGWIDGRRHCPTDCQKLVCAARQPLLGSRFHITALHSLHGS